jgi:hypothetical protein
MRTKVDKLLAAKATVLGKDNLKTLSIFLKSISFEKCGIN